MLPPVMPCAGHRTRHRHPLAAASIVRSHGPAPAQGENRSRHLSPVSCPLSPDGFSLLELVMTIVILSFLALILLPLFRSVTAGGDPVIRARGVALGQALMDEIINKKWDEATPMGGGPLNTTESSRGSAAAGAIGPEPGETRPDYDDVDDYDGLFEQNSFRDQNNTAFTLNGYSRRAQVTYIPSNTTVITATSPAGTRTAATATDTKRVVVTVTMPNNESFSLVSLKCNY